MGAGVEMPMETDGPGGAGGVASLDVRLLGPLTISRGGVALPLPASRKVRALFAYLALAPHPAARSQLCELLWDVPDDPRGELRWCLSKIRRLVDGPGRRRVQTQAKTIRLDLSDCFVDVIEIAHAVQGGIGTLTVEQLHALSALFVGGFLDGLEIGRSPVFEGWLVAQRRRLRDCHAALLEQLVRSGPSDSVFEYLEKWLQLAPFDQRAHETLLTALARRGRIREGEEQLAASARLFEAEGLDHRPLREAWRTARAQADGLPQARAAAPVPIEAPRGTRRESVLIEPRRASIAVMPFAGQAACASIPGGPADGLAHDVITQLAKLRSLFVIAQGTVFALREQRIAPEDPGRILNVDYVVSGSLHCRGKQLSVAVELAEVCTARIVWAEVFNHMADEAFAVLDEIGNRIVAPLSPMRSRPSSATGPSCGRRILSMRGMRITAAYGTPTGSTAPTMSKPSASSRWRCASIRPFRAPMPGSPSRISRTLSKAG